MNPVLIKSLMGVGLAGATIAGGYGIYSHLSNYKTLGNILESQGFTLLDVDGTSDDSLWDNNIASHKTANAQTPKLFGYEEDTIGSTEDEKKTNNRNKMKVLCKHLFRSFSSEKSKLDEAKKWCVKSSSASAAQK